MGKAVGKLRHLITIEESTDAIGDFGETTRTWTTVDSVYASREVAAANETIKAQQLDNPITYMFVVRFRTDLSPDNRINDGTKYYTIHSITDKLGDYKFLNIVATEIQQGASGTI